MKKGIGSFEVFMTAADEYLFSKILKEEFSGVLFIDCYPWPDPHLDPRIKNSIDQCHDRLNSHAGILNTSIFSKSDYQKKWIRKSLSNREEYHPTATGPGLIQFLHSKEAKYSPDGLMNASLGYSYDINNDKKTEEFVNATLKICKKNSQKLYLIDPKTGLVSDKPHSRFFAWPDAVAKYDQVNGMYLTNNTMAYFTTKK